MRLTYFGHSCFLLETAKARLVLDPFFTGNPSCQTAAADVPCDFVLVSHGHEDHSGDAVELSKRHGATIIAGYELAEYFAAQGAKTHGLGVGGGANFPFGRVKLTLAHHSSSVEAGLKPVYLGVASGLELPMRLEEVDPGFPGRQRKPAQELVEDLRGVGLVVFRQRVGAARKEILCVGGYRSGRVGNEGPGEREEKK